MLKVKGEGVISLGVGSGRGDEPVLAGVLAECPSCGKRHVFPLPEGFRLKDAVEVELRCGELVSFQVSPVDALSELEFKKHRRALNKIEAFRRRFYKRVELLR